MRFKLFIRTFFFKFNFKDLQTTILRSLQASKILFSIQLLFVGEHNTSTTAQTGQFVVPTPIFYGLGFRRIKSSPLQSPSSTAISAAASEFQKKDLFTVVPMHFPVNSRGPKRFLRQAALFCGDGAHSLRIVAHPEQYGGYVRIDPFSCGIPSFVLQSLLSLHDKHLLSKLSTSPLVLKIQPMIIAADAITVL